MGWCEVCGVTVPAGGEAQHRSGRRHNSMRFYGEPNRQLRPIELRDNDGVRLRLLRPVEVPDAAVALARAGRELAVPRLVAHTGVSFFTAATRNLEVETMVAAAVGLQQRWRRAQAEVELQEAGPTTILCAAARVLTGEYAEGLELRVSVRNPASQLAQMLTSAALYGLAKALAEARRPLSLDLRIGSALHHRRLLTMLLGRLRDSLDHGTHILRLRLAAAGGSLQPDDVAALHNAACSSWARRATSFLLGTHPRVGEASWIRLLPSAITGDILDMAATEARTEVLVEEQQVEPAPAATAEASNVGNDMAYVAANYAQYAPHDM